MKKILLLTPMLHQGGFERVCVETARLLENEYDVTIGVFSLDDLAFDVGGLKIVNLNLPVRDSRVGKILNVFKRAQALSKLYSDLNIEDIYSFGITANRISALSQGTYKASDGRKVKVKKIMACHSFEEVKDKGYMTLLDKKADVILCCSKKMSQIARELTGSEKIITLWNPFDVEKIQRQSAERDLNRAAYSSSKTCDTDNAGCTKTGPALITMGREDDVKGYWHLLKAFVRVRESYPHATLTLVGDGTFTELKDMAVKAGAADCITFTGHQMNPFPYLKRADVYVLSSLSEGLPMALVEAMSLGLPVVSVNCLSGPAEILSTDFEDAETQTGVYAAEYGLLTTPFSKEKDIQISFNENNKIILTSQEEDLASGILKLWGDEELRKKYSQKGPLRAGDFSKENYKCLLCGLL